jgi:hypothetical protein
MECINLANRSAEKARKNPENYVFFIAAMFHAFGEDAEDFPESIPKTWYFRILRPTRNTKVFGAADTP